MKEEYLHISIFKISNTAIGRGSSWFDVVFHALFIRLNGTIFILPSLINLRFSILEKEKSLKSERYSHQQTRDEMTNKAREEKDLSEKTVMETNMKLSSLQQHFKLLKSEQDDSKDECAKSKVRQLEQINGLEKKVKSLESSNDLAIKEKNKEIELLKVMYNYNVNAVIFIIQH